MPKNIKVEISNELIGVRYGFFIPSNKTLYVSPAIAKLIKHDVALLSKSLRILQMPLNENGKEKFNSLNVWLNAIINAGIDIFCVKDV
jgi:hypothetical protein